MLASLASGPGAVFPTLPDSAPGYAYPVVGATLVLLALIYYAANRIKPPNDPAPASRAVAGGKDDGSPARVDSDYRVLDETIDRLEKRLEKAETAHEAMRRAYEQQRERNHDLEMQLAERDNTLTVAREEIATLRATLRALQQPLHSDWWRDPYSRTIPPLTAPPSRPQPPLQQQRRPSSPVDYSRVADPDTPTDPIPGSRAAP